MKNDSILTPRLLLSLQAKGLIWDEGDVWDLQIRDSLTGKTLAFFNSDASPGTICREVDLWLGGFAAAKSLSEGS